MRVYFRVLFPSTGEMRSEFELAAPTGEQAQKLAKMYEFEGEIVISGYGGPDFLIAGALEAWVQNLCFDAVARTCAGEPSSILNFNGPGRVEVVPDGDTVRMQTDAGEAAVFPRDELAAELVACGVRFLHWAREQKAQDAGYCGNLDYIEGFLGPAKAALERRTK
ncbi:MAG: hypothetical protein P8Y58_07135 [Novosphingobium sp.]